MNEKVYDNRTYTENVFWRLYEDQIRKCNRSNLIDSDGTIKGTWEGDIFRLDDAYIPEKFNPDGYTMKQIKEYLNETYGIHFSGIPFINGRMDFSELSLADVELDDIILEAANAENLWEEVGLSYVPEGLKMESLGLDMVSDLYDKVFTAKRRTKNFLLADALAAEKGIPIPGLTDGYTAKELKCWRKKNKFTWHESFYGYFLVPAVIHGNVSHSGLVSRQKGLSDIPC